MYSLPYISVLALYFSLALAVPFKSPFKHEARRNRNNSTSGRPNPTYSQETLNSLKLALSEVDRLKILQGLGSPDDYFKFDFNIAANPNPVAGAGKGGQGDLAYVDNFPVLINLGVSMSMGFMNPCGMNTPHTHNRATEFLTIVKGGNVKVSFVQESGFSTPIETTLSLYQGSILPQGSIHYEFNDSCEPAIFVAAFSNEDPGLSRTAQNFFIEDPGVVDADLGFPSFLNGVDISKFQSTIPKAFALGAAECLKRCNINYNTSTPSPFPKA